MASGGLSFRVLKAVSPVISHPLAVAALERVKTRLMENGIHTKAGAQIMRTGLRAVKTCEGRGGTECRPSASSPSESGNCSPVSHALELCGLCASEKT